MGVVLPLAVVGGAYFVGSLYSGRIALGDISNSISNGNGIEGGWARNAISHSYTSAVLADEFGSGFAEFMGDVNEFRPNNDPVSEFHDQWNNEVGRQIAEWAEQNNIDLTSQNLDDLLIDAYNNGDLITDRTDPRIPSDLEQNPVDPAPSWNGPSSNWQGSSQGRSGDGSQGSGYNPDGSPADSGGVPSSGSNGGNDPANPSNPFGPAGDGYPNPFGDRFGDLFDFPPTSPLVLDLDLDGAIELTPYANTNTSYFDLDGDGFVEQTGWVSPDDGFLAIDLNSDGVINDISELFGNSTTDGFVELAGLDSNSDGIIDTNDAQFSDLLVLQDADGDGYSDSGELTSLSSHNIASIDLNYTTVNGKNQGHDVSTQSTVSLAGGGTMLVQDIWFQHNQANSYYVIPDNFTYDEEVFGLPQLRGSGDVADLWVAMSQNSALKASVSTLVNADYSNFSFASFADNVEGILFDWLGVDGVNPTSRGSHIDARILAGMEAWVGRDFVQAGAANPRPNAAELAKEMWDQFVADTAVKLIAQVEDVIISKAYQDGIDYLQQQRDAGVDIKSYSAQQVENIFDSYITGAETAIQNHYFTSSFSDISFDYESNSITADFTAFIDTLELNEPTQNGDKQNYWQDLVPMINAVADSQNLSDADYAAALGSTYLDQIVGDVIGLRNDTMTIGTSGDDVITTDDANDYIVGGLGDDTLNGGYGNDTYLYNLGDGDDTIDDPGIGPDTLLFGIGISWYASRSVY